MSPGSGGWWRPSAFGLGAVASGGSFSGRAQNQMRDGVVLLLQLDDGLPAKRPLCWPSGTSQPQRQQGEITLGHPGINGPLLGDHLCLVLSGLRGDAISPAASLTFRCHKFFSIPCKSCCERVRK